MEFKGGAGMNFNTNGFVMIPLDKYERLNELALKGEMHEKNMQYKEEFNKTWGQYKDLCKKVEITRNTLHFIWDKLEGKSNGLTVQPEYDKTDMLKDINKILEYL